MKYESGRKILPEFVALRPKTYSYIIGDGNSDKKQTEQKNPL